MGDMVVRCELKGRYWSGLMWDLDLVINYLKISNEELRNNEKDWMVTKWLKHKHQPVIHTLSYM